VEPLTEELPDDGKRSQADEGFGTRRQGASPFKAPDVDLNGERLHLAASNRLAGGVLTNRKGIGGAGSSRGGKRSLARGYTLMGSGPMPSFANTLNSQ
jgi:hypothetical protein